MSVYVCDRSLGMSKKYLFEISSTSSSSSSGSSSSSSSSSSSRSSSNTVYRYRAYILLFHSHKSTHISKKGIRLHLKERFKLV